MNCCFHRWDVPSRQSGLRLYNQPSNYPAHKLRHGKILLLLIILLSIVPATCAASEHQISIYVSPAEQATNPGTKARPVATREAAQKLVRSQKALGKVTAWLCGGTYYLPETLLFTPQDSGTEKVPVTYAAYEKSACSVGRHFTKPTANRSSP
jgi:hypothetical protein